MVFGRRGHFGSQWPNTGTACERRLYRTGRLRCSLRIVLHTLGCDRYGFAQHWSGCSSVLPTTGKRSLAHARRRGPSKRFADRPGRRYGPYCAYFTMASWCVGILYKRSGPITRKLHRTRNRQRQKLAAGRGCSALTSTTTKWNECPKRPLPPNACASAMSC